jgi:predicted nucleic acid-binding protein
MILVDSDILIAHLRQRLAAREWLLAARRRTGPLGISVVSIAEITGGMRSGERREVSRLIDSLRPFPVDTAVAVRAGELQRRFRRSHSAIGLADYLIAATADTHGLELATLNVRHFPMIVGLAAPFSV